MQLIFWKVSCGTPYLFQPSLIWSTYHDMSLVGGWVGRVGSCNLNSSLPSHLPSINYHQLSKMRSWHKFGVWWKRYRVGAILTQHHFHCSSFKHYRHSSKWFLVYLVRFPNQLAFESLSIPTKSHANCLQFMIQKGAKSMASMSYQQGSFDVDQSVW